MASFGVIFQYFLPRSEEGEGNILELLILGAYISTRGPGRLELNLLTPNVNYSGRTAPLTSKVAFYIFIQQI